MRRPEAERLTSCVGKERESSEIADLQPPRSSVNGPSRQRPVISQGTCPQRSQNPSQTFIVAVCMRMTPLLCRWNGRMGWMKAVVFGCTPGLTTATDNANPILKHKKTPWSCVSWKGSCRKAQKTPWRSWSRRWFASPQVHPFFDYFLVADLARQFSRTNFDKYHPGYFGKVGMRQFHLTNNQYWRPVINVDKLWSLVPEEEKKGLKETSEVVPVIDTLHHGYGKVLGNGKCVLKG